MTVHDRDVGKAQIIAAPAAPDRRERLGLGASCAQIASAVLRRVRRAQRQTTHRRANVIAVSIHPEPEVFAARGPPSRGLCVGRSGAGSRSLQLSPTTASRWEWPPGPRPNTVRTYPLGMG